MVKYVCQEFFDGLPFEMASSSTVFTMKRMI
jgi:hypothetical protein